MFGNHHQPPKPPKYEPYIMLLLAIVIALVLSMGFILFKILGEKMNVPV